MMKFIVIAMESNGRALHRARTMSFLLLIQTGNWVGGETREVANAGDKMGNAKGLEESRSSEDGGGGFKNA